VNHPCRTLSRCGRWLPDHVLSERFAGGKERMFPYGSDGAC
jgi:hypothetical protein